ncbi:LysR family transcriptional regulator [Phytopseudomonas daroniae]|uniref:LysR family transcriptional regulator n=1 Tax=Phytopseudomonas daroniae TaxID=2487519 RepID=UPI0010383C1E|nr:LysR family transcriptional regulator [Pseudomonas daroniae]TBU73248.1 LysR family transcriptional regulator [Pseudomonas daroniae]
MDSADLQFFATVAKVGSISKAAARLDTVQSNVTQRIRRLEAELGIPLFHRHGRGVTLTPAGVQLLPYANQIDQMLDEARRVILDDATPTGQLRIGSMETTAAFRLPPLLVDYSGHFPAVNLSLNTGTTRSLIEDVLERRMDVAFVAGSVEHEELIAETVLTEELVIVTAPWVRRVEDRPAWLPSTTNVKIAIFRNGCAYRERLEVQLIQNGVHTIQRMELGTLDGILGCVQAGLAITLLPVAIVETLVQAGRVAVHRLKGNEGLVDTVLIRRRDAYVTTALASFMAKTKEHSIPVAAVSRPLH